MNELRNAIIDATEDGFTVLFSFDRQLGDIRTTVRSMKHHASRRVSRKYIQEAEFEVLGDAVRDCVRQILGDENLASPTAEATMPESKSLTPRGDT